MNIQTALVKNGWDNQSLGLGQVAINFYCIQHVFTTRFNGFVKHCYLKKRIMKYESKIY